MRRRRGQSSRDQTFPSMMVRWMDLPTQRYSYGRFCCSHGTYVLVTLQSSLDHHHRTIGITIWLLAGSKCICCYARRRHLRVCRSLVGNPSQVNREFRPAILDCRSAQRLPFSLANLPELSYLPANNIRARYERRRIILCCSIGRYLHLGNNDDVGGTHWGTAKNYSYLGFVEIKLSFLLGLCSSSISSGPVIWCWQQTLPPQEVPRVRVLVKLICTQGSKRCGYVPSYVHTHNYFTVLPVQTR